MERTKMIRTAEKLDAFFRVMEKVTVIAAVAMVVVMVAMLWYARSKSNERAVLGFCSAMVCTLFDMYYIGSCMAFIMLHRYDEERGEQNEKLNYAFYPVVLLVVGIVGFFL